MQVFHLIFPLSTARLVGNERSSNPYPATMQRTRHPICILLAMMKRRGTIIAPSNLNIQEHEMSTARAIADYGMDVEFVARIEGNRAKSADFVGNGVLWEVKSPTSDNLRVVQKRLREAIHQSRDIIFDSRRMRRLTNKSIQAEVEKWAKNLTSIRRLLYINRMGEVVKIK